MTDEQSGQGHNTRDEQSWIYTQEHLGPNLVLFLPNCSVIPNSTEEKNDECFSLSTIFKII